MSTTVIGSSAAKPARRPGRPTGASVTPGHLLRPEGAGFPAKPTGRPPLGEIIHENPTSRTNPQTRRPSRTFRAASLPGADRTRPAAPRRSPALALTAHPVLVGDRATLRALRAAEMEAWEATGPIAARQPESVGLPGASARVRLGTGGFWDGESLLFILLALCAAAAVLVGIYDTSVFVTGLSRLVEAIRNLLA